MQWPTPPKKNRYEVEPGPRGPERQEGTPEVRPDLPSVDTEKGDRLPIDAAYAGKVSKFFNERRKVADVTDADDTEYFDHDAFLSMEQQSLEKLADPATAERMEPKDAAMALGDLAGTMAKRNPDVPANVSGDARADANSEQQYVAARDIFMDSSRKLFPHVKVHSEEFGTDLANTARRLGEAADAQDIHSLDPKEIERLRETDPKALAAKIDDMLFQVGDVMQSRARISFDLGDPRRKEEASGHLAAGVEMYYKLQLYRDELQKDLFGRTDTSKSEEAEIDRIRAGLLGSGGEEGERAPELSAADRGTLDAVERALAAEDEEAKRAEAQGKDFTRKDRPMVEGFRAVWKQDSELARRLRTLSDRIEEDAGRRIERMQPPNGELAYELAVGSAFRDLAPGERAALEKAAMKEKERAKEPPMADDPKDEPRVRGEALFTEFMREVIDGRKG